MSTFKKNQIIKTAQGKFRCIVADKELAVFAPVVLKTNGGARTKLSTGLFIVSNDKAVQHFDYKTIGKIKDGLFIKS